MFNSPNMQQQLQRMQQQANRLQAELDGMTFTGTAGGGVIEVDVSGQTRFKTIRIKPEAINPEHPETVSQETLRLVEDLIEAAVKDASKQAAKVAREKIEAVTAGVMPGSEPPKQPEMPPKQAPKDDDDDENHGFGNFGGGGFGNLLG